MGCYDAIQFNCLDCGAVIEAQSKGGRCMMDVFPCDAVPIEVAGMPIGDVVKCKCGSEFKVAGPAYVQLRLERQPSE